MTNKTILIETPRLRIRRADLSDLNYILNLQAKPENLKFIVPFDEKIHTLILTSNGTQTMDVVVEERDTNKLVGYFMLNDLNNPHNKVEFMHVIIDKKGCGYGREALQALLKWSFDVKKFHRVYLDCKTYNEVALHLYESVGFKREGIMRDVIRVNGVYEDLILLSILENDFKSIS
ncbi:MAG: GNAT family N-acetyltransferase [Selenomonadaceae bacterium]|nr:GNAT family N-acetyltransferase [Selenomonadaceae bacterium]